MKFQMCVYPPRTLFPPFLLSSVPLSFSFSLRRTEIQLLVIICWDLSHASQKQILGIYYQLSSANCFRGRTDTQRVSMLWYIQKFLEHVLPHVIGSPRYGLKYSTHMHTPYLYRGSKLRAWRWQVNMSKKPLLTQAWSGWCEITQGGLLTRPP